MNRKRVAIRFLLCLCLIASSQASDTWIVREDGVGPVKVGMNLSQLNVALHERFLLPAEKEDQGCFYVNPTKHPQVSFMIENRRLVRIEVDHPGVAKLEGIQVGDSESRVLKLYGRRLKVEPRAYMEEDGHFLTIRSRDGHYGVRFETDHGKITGFYSGGYHAIQYIEGCE